MSSSNTRVKYTDKYLRELLKEEGYQFIGIVIGSSPRRMLVKHNLCGKTYDVRVDKFVSEGQRCSCMRKRDSAMIANTKEYQDKLNEVHGEGEYTVMSNYLGRKKPITIKHHCGHEYEITRAEYLMEINTGGKCPICSSGISIQNKIDDVELETVEYVLKIKFRKNGTIIGNIDSEIFIQNEDGNLEINNSKFALDSSRVLTQTNQRNILKLIEESKLT